MSASLPATMRAYRLLQWQQPPRLVETDVPRPGRGQVVVRVAGNGLCHSDVGMAQMPAEFGEAIGWRMPFTLGHEVAGWIADAGDDVEGYSVGDPVALVSPASCGRCRFCLRGQDSACPNGLVGRGYGHDGGLAPYVLVDTVRSLLPLRTLDPVVAGPLTDAGATSYHAVKRLLPRLAPESTAVVLGAGGLGSFAIQHLRALSSARVIAVDRSVKRLEVAREMGAHEAIEGIGAGTTSELLELTGGDGADAVLDFVGIDSSIKAGLGAVRPTGAFALIGASGGGFSGPWYGGLPRDGEVFTFQGSSISDAQDVLALAEAGLIRSEVDVFSLDQVAEAYEALDAGQLRGRAVVTPES